MYKLTEEGSDYLKNGLPEKQLLKSIGNEKSLEDISKLPKAGIAIGWARRNAWIKIDKKSVKITELGKKAIGEKTKVENALEEVEKKGNTDQELIKILLSRNLIFETKEVIQPTKKVSFWQRLRGKNGEKKKEEMKSEIAQLTPELIKTGEWKNKRFRNYDVNAPAPKVYAGKKQPFIQFEEDIRDKLIGLGFQEMKGPLVETSFWNCDALFIPQDHPAKSMQDIFYMKKPKTGTLPDENFVSKEEVFRCSGIFCKCL